MLRCMSEKNYNWEQIKTFLYVLRHGSFSAAAKELGIKQSTISRQIEALESQIGFPLFTRSQRGVIATDSALRLKPHLENIGAAAEALAREAQSSDSEVSGKVRITTNEPLALEILSSSLAKIQEKFPKIKFEISISEKAADLLSREADIAIRVGKTSQKAILTKRVGTLEMGLHCSNDYFSVHEPPEDVNGLRFHPIIGFDSLTERAIQVMNLPDIFQKDSLTYSTDSSALQAQLIDSGCGIGLCFVNAKRKNRIRVLSGLVQFRADVWIAMHENLKTSKKFRLVFREFSEIIRSELSEAQASN